MSGGMGSAEDVEVIRRGYLKYKLQSTSKSPKEFWFVFRTHSNQDKCLEFFASERESLKKNSTPRDRLPLGNVRSVYKPDAKVFCLQSLDGPVHMFEAHSSIECNEWVFGLNAVLFGKGPDGGQVVRFNIEVWSCAQFRYSGAGLMEIRNDQMIVWSQNEEIEVVRWQLGHIRSFKAKQNQLQIVAGSRSATGEGIFVFGTSDSVLITHTLETVIYQLAQMKRAQRNTPHQQQLQSQSISAPPPKPAPYKPKWREQTLVRGRTGSDEIVPGFTDIPGSRGPEQSLGPTAGNTHLQPYSQLTHDGSQKRSPTRSRSAKVVGTPASDSEYSSLHSESHTEKPDIYSDINPYDSLSPASLPVTPPRSVGKYQTLPSRRSGEDYQYTDTIPQLVAPTSSLSVAPSVGRDTGSLIFGEVRHFSSQRSKTEIGQRGNEDYSTIPDDYSYLNPVDRSTNLPDNMYNSLKFEETPPTEGGHASSERQMKSLPVNVPLPPRKTSTGYEQVGPPSPKNPPSPIMPHPRSNYNKLVPPTRGTPDTTYDRLGSVTPTFVTPTDRSPGNNAAGMLGDDLELHYEVSPVLARKELYRTPEASPSVSPVSHRKVAEPLISDYDEVDMDDRSSPLPPLLQNRAPAVIPKNSYDEVPIDGEEPSQDNTNGYSRIARKQADETADPYSHLSFSIEQEPYSTLSHNKMAGRTTMSSLFDEDYSDVPNALANPNPDMWQQQVTSLPSNDTKTAPPIPPRKGQSSGMGDKSHDCPTKPVPAPKPKPKPKRTVIIN